MMHVNEAANAAVPPGAGDARPRTPLGLAIRKFGNRVPVQVIHACNTVTKQRFRELQNRMDRADLERAAEMQRRAREDRRAMRVDMESWWGEVMRG